MGKKIVTVSLIETFYNLQCCVLSALLLYTHYACGALSGYLCNRDCSLRDTACLKEYDSEGFVTNALTILTGLNNLICLGVFTLSLSPCSLR